MQECLHVPPVDKQTAARRVYRRAKMLPFYQHFILRPPSELCRVLDRMKQYRVVLPGLFLAQSVAALAAVHVGVSDPSGFDALDTNGSSASFTMGLTGHPPVNSFTITASDITPGTGALNSIVGSVADLTPGGTVPAYVNPGWVAERQTVPDGPLSGTWDTFIVAGGLASNSRSITYSIEFANPIDSTYQLMFFDMESANESVTITAFDADGNSLSRASWTFGNFRGADTTPANGLVNGYSQWNPAIPAL